MRRERERLDADSLSQRPELRRLGKGFTRQDHDSVAIAGCQSRMRCAIFSYPAVAFKKRRVFWHASCTAKELELS